MEAKTIKVSSTSDPKKVAGSIVSTLEEGKLPVVTTIGPIALNQGVKAIIISRGLCTRKGWDLRTPQSFVCLDTKTGTMTAIRHEIHKIDLQENLQDMEPTS